MTRRFHISDTDLRDLLVDRKFNSRTNQYTSTCPFCGKQGHFYIDRTTQLFDCKKCGEQGSVYKLLRHLNRLDLLDGASVEFKTQISSIRQSQTQQQEPEEELPVIKMPVGFRVGEQVDGYLSYRGLTPDDVRRYSLGHTALVQRFLNYILMPIYDGGQIKGFLGRYASSKVPLGKLRYNNSRGTNFAGLLYGYDEIARDATQTVILVEGVFDKFRLDKVLGLHQTSDIKCCSTFGKKISDRQINKLLDKRVTNVILMFDKDAIKEMKSYGLELQKYFHTVIGYVEGKDIDASTDEQIQDAFTKLRSPEDFINSTIRKI